MACPIATDERFSLQTLLRGSAFSGRFLVLAVLEISGGEWIAMDWMPIRKPLNPPAVMPNLVDYNKVFGDFSWAAVRREFEGLPHGGGFNLAHEAVDRHANGALRNHLAIRWLAKDGRVVDFTYGDLQRETNRFANLLRELGIGKGDRVFALAGRVPELYIAALGTLKNGSVFCPLFSAFGPEPIQQRLSIAEGKVLVTTNLLYGRRKISDLWSALPDLEHVLVISNGDDASPPGTHNFRKLMAEASDRFEIPPTDPEDMALIHFTSGTTGRPKGAVHVHKAVIAHHIPGTYALAFHPGA